MRVRTVTRWTAAVALAQALAATPAGAVRFGGVGGPAGQWRFMRGGNGAVGQLPVTGSDGHGGGWMVYQPWCLQSQGNMPAYGADGQPDRERPAADFGGGGERVGPHRREDGRAGG